MLLMDAFGAEATAAESVVFFVLVLPPQLNDDMENAVAAKKVSLDDNIMDLIILIDKQF